MTTAREDILARVRKSIGTREPSQPIAREYRRHGTLPESEKIDLFVSRLEDYNARVFRCDETALPATIAEAIAARGKTTMLIPSGLPAEWLPVGFTFTRDNQHSYRDIDAMDGVLTAASVAIAMTGSIILTHSETEGRRALTLIPDYHLCVVRTSQLVETVPEGLRALGARRTSPVTTIAGPSATADIEMIRVKGVHGPRTLDVIIVT